ncbi:50S ribosomal protein L30 [Candidatus Woesearchaeota archaeon]|nr:50S ribosomal protein L30 [Candidatus Woesearchaeota archaeon]
MEQTKTKKPEEPTGPQTTGTKRIAVILVRGLIDLRKPVRDTLTMLRLTRKNNCIVLEDTAVMRGMIKKVKDYITWGEISTETFQELVDKKGEEYLGPETDSKGKIKYNRFFTHNNKKYKKYFRLNSPKKGFGRKGIKIPFKIGGGLGYRGEKINDLIQRMTYTD